MSNGEIQRAMAILIMDRFMDLPPGEIKPLQFLTWGPLRAGLRALEIEKRTKSHAVFKDDAYFLFVVSFS
jgi:hypothetical protein